LINEGTFAEFPLFLKSAQVKEVTQFECGVTLLETNIWHLLKLYRIPETPELLNKINVADLLAHKDRLAA